MARPVCIVFSDAYAFECYQKTEGLGNNYYTHKILPGAGYSSNLHYLLFEGKTPDEVGFFSDYSWRRPQNALKCGKFAKICDSIVTLNNLVRVVRRKIIKKYDNIPFSESLYFVRNGKYKFMQNEVCKVFGITAEKIYLPSVEENFRKANELIQQGKESIIVVLEDLDHIGHQVGLRGERYVQRARQINQETRKLFQNFTARFPDGVCILISDHGMTDVTASIDITGMLIRRFGLPGAKYQFYNDSLYLRVWADDEAYLKKIQAFLDSVTAMSFLDKRTREQHGITKKEYGQLIYVLRHGYAFEPNCFGVAIRGCSYGLHGYMEPTDDNSGILVINKGLSVKDVRAGQVYDMVVNLIHGQ